MPHEDLTDVGHESSPAARGGAGAYIEGELGASYLLALLADVEPRGLPGARIRRVRYQGVDQGFSLDDLVVHGTSHAGEMLLEIQSKRTISFAPKDKVFEEVCGQVARSTAQGIPEDGHRLAVATQRTSRAISGPYQDVLEWARKAATGVEFFTRLASKGVSGPDMRRFADTFRTNLVAAGVANDDNEIWRFITRRSSTVLDPGRLMTGELKRFKVPVVWDATDLSTARWARCMVMCRLSGRSIDIRAYATRKALMHSRNYLDRETPHKARPPVEEPAAVTTINFA